MVNLITIGLLLLNHLNYSLTSWYRRVRELAVTLCRLKLLIHRGKLLQCWVETNLAGHQCLSHLVVIYYLQGPTFDQNVSAGTYYIKVFNQNNTGKYSLATGAIESFPPYESLKALITIPLLKEQIFGKPVTVLFFEFLGIVLALGTIMVLAVMAFIGPKVKGTCYYNS